MPAKPQESESKKRRGAKPTLTFKVSHEEKAWIEAEARRIGKPVATHLRDVALAGADAAVGSDAAPGGKIERLAAAVLSLAEQQAEIRTQFSNMAVTVDRLIRTLTMPVKR